jgi:hypothetical protein
MSKAIPPPEKLLQYQPLTKWDQKEAELKINELYKAMLALADGTITWYQSYRKSKGYWSKGIRIIAIVILVCSTLMPYIASINESNATLLYIGYLLIMGILTAGPDLY